MKYADEIRDAGSRDAWAVHEWLERALSAIRRGINGAEGQLEEVAMDLGEVEDALVEIMDAIDKTAAWVDEGCPDRDEAAREAEAP